MQPYKNLSGISGVAAYDFGFDRIIVQFDTGVIFTYTYDSAGRVNVEQMKIFAACGKGLHTYINQTPAVKYGYIR